MFLTFEQISANCNLIKGHRNDYWEINPPLRLEIRDPPLEDWAPKSWFPDNIVHADILGITNEKGIQYTRVHIIEVELWYNTFLFKLT